MGINCEINLYKPSDGAFRPGNIVSGSIRYAIDKETVFYRITVSLKGRGDLTMQKREYVDGRTRVRIGRNHEEYVREDRVIYEGEKVKHPINVGSYEVQFNFTLPHRIPPSFSNNDYAGVYSIDCEIKYYIRIKFEKASLLSFNKNFRKEITVLSGITPKLFDGPIVCGQEKVLTSPFSSKRHVVNITANIKHCVIKSGGKIEFDYEVANNTNVVVKAVKTKLIETNIFTSDYGTQATDSKKVKDTYSKSGSIKPGEVKTIPAEINVPLDKVSLDYSKMVARDYAAQITVILPFPHSNAILNIPLQIGDVDEAIDGAANYRYTPELVGAPSYWEAMEEETENNKEG